MLRRSCVLAVAVLGCQKPAPTPMQAPVVTASAVDAAPPIDEEPIDAFQARFQGEAVIHALGGYDKLPQMPAITADGKWIALDLGYSHGMGYWHTYEWGIYGATGKLEDRISIIDEKRADDSAIPTQAELAPLVEHLRGKLAGFHPMVQVQGPTTDEHGKGTLKLGAGTLAVDNSQGLEVVWTPKSGAPKRISAAYGPHCGGAGKLSQVWFDELHDRLAYVVSFMGRDSCPDDAPEWHVY